MACRIWYGTVLVTYLCAVLVESGSLRKQRCDAERFLRCFASAVDVIIFPDAYDFKSLAKDCRVLDSVDSCTQYMEIGGCSDESKQWFHYLKSDFASLRSHICDPNLHTSMDNWNHCLKETIFDASPGAYYDKSTTLGYDLLLTRNNSECSYRDYECYAKTAEGCLLTTLARETVKDVYNTIFDLKNFPRFDGLSNKQRCDAERFSRCFERAIGHITFPVVPESLDDKSLAKDCKNMKSDDSCTKYIEIGGCSDEVKQRLQHLKSDFASLRSHICNPTLHTSMFEWFQCMDTSVAESCMKLVPDDVCRPGEYNCMLAATTKCTRDSPAIKAVHHLVNTVLALNNCSRVDWNSGITTSPKLLLTFTALCISLFLLRQ